MKPAPSRQPPRQPPRVRACPLLYEVNAWVWLHGWQRRLGCALTLGELPEAALAELVSTGADAVWLMGVWERSPAGREQALHHPDLQHEYRRALPDVAAADVVGSPYAIHRYEVAPELGGEAAFGPLHLGAYVQLTGYDLPLRSPQPGGGVYLSVRPRMAELRLRPAVDASFGRLRLPLESLHGQPRGEFERTFVVSVAGSIGVSVTEALSLEARVEYSHYFATEAGSDLGSQSIAMLAGMTIHIP